MLDKLGGYEIGGIVGPVLGAVLYRNPVEIDGFKSNMGALIALVLNS